MTQQGTEKVNEMSVRKDPQFSVENQPQVDSLCGTSLIPGKNGGISMSPIAWLKSIRPGKPPQFAYQLLKQGLPHIMVDPKGTGKLRPMIPPELQPAAEEFLLNIEDHQQTRQQKADSPSEQSQTDIAQQSIRRQLHSKTSHLALYERLPGIITVALLENPTGPQFMYYKNALDLQRPTLNKKPQHFLQYDTLREHIHDRKILLDSSRNILRLVIESLRRFPVFESDLQLAEALQSLLQQHPDAPIQAPQVNADTPREELDGAGATQETTQQTTNKEVNYVHKHVQDVPEQA